MKIRHGVKRRGKQFTLLGILALLLGLLAPAPVALAHPLDAYLQATYITVAPARIVVELDLTPGVLLAPQVLPQLDPSGDQQISDAEGRAYVDDVLRHVVLSVDGQPQLLALDKIDMPPYLNVQAGYGTIRIFTSVMLKAGMTLTHRIYYKNSFAPTGALYQVNAFVDKGVAVTLGKQNRDSIQQSMTMDYSLGVDVSTAGASGAPASAPAASLVGSAAALTTGASAGASEQARQLLGYLYAPVLTPWALVLALALAGVLGALHALTPGHGKTLVAAYLVGSRGTVRHAVLLGSTVTLTHTASVIVIGVLALFASQFVLPKVFVPVLEILSGLLVVLMGARLVWQRWIAFHNRRRQKGDLSHDHGQAPAHPYRHDHGDGRPHSHLPPAPGLKLGSLIAMGVSGGLVPCPEALGIMVIAIGLNRILLGLGLIVLFSMGLAVVLIIIGVLLVRSRALVERFGGMSKGWGSALPLASAVIVTALGLGIMLRGLVSYLL